MRFVGRAFALAELSRFVDDAAGGRGGLRLVAGDPGIGKTTLAAELAARATEVDAVWGSCWEGDGAPALWPWIQVLRAVGRRRPAVAPGPILGRLVPEFGGVGEPRGDFDERARFQLFDAIGAFLRAAGEARPLLVVLDDLHWADTSTLVLLGFLVPALRGARVAVVGTYRGLEVPAGHALHRLVSARSGVVPLEGLAPEEVADLARDVARAGVSPSAAEGLHRATGGNPFFVRELLHLPDGAAVPDSVGEVIRARVARASPEARALLDAAAVLGHEGRLDVIAQLADVGAAAELRAARLLDEVIDAPPRVRFPHALLREVVYRDLPPARRMALHRQVGEALEARGADPAELAHHFARGGATGEALVFAERAGRRALSAFAYEDAAAHFERALALAPVDAPPRRAEILYALGRAQRAAGRTADAHRSFEEVAGLSPPPELLAAVALGFAVEFTAGVVDPAEVRLLEQALSSLPADDHPLRARVLARLAKAQLFSPTAARRAELGESAVAMARRLGDPAALAAVLYDHHVALWGGANVEERLAIADEAVSLAERCGDAELALQVRALRLGNLLELGDLATMQSEVDAYDALATRLRQPHYLWHVPLLRGTLAMLACRFDEALRLAGEGLAMATQAQHQGASIFHAAVAFTTRLQQGRLGDEEPRLRAIAARWPALVVFRSTWVFALACAGRRDEARQELERLTADRLERVPRDFTWVCNLAMLSLTAAALDDRCAAALLYDLLLPYRSYCVRITRIGIGAMGAVAHYLGLLAATLGEWALAAEHLERAVHLNLRIGAPGFTANSRHELARAARALGRTARAAEEAERAQVAADALGFRLLLPAPSAAPRAACELRREGEAWRVRFRGAEFRVRDSLGVGYLARLLAAQGSEVHVLALSAVEAPSPGTPLLDARAKAEVKQRLEALDDDLRAAEEAGDVARAALARERIDELADEWSRAVGLGGRDRRAGSDLERARMRVTKAIKAAVRKMGEHDRALAEHLDRSVRTGAYCGYAPDPALGIAWTVDFTT